MGNVRLSYSDNSQTLTDNSFESTAEGWGGNASVLSLENGKLKTEVSNQWAGAQKFLDVAPGDEIHYQMLLDKATTESLNVIFFEHDGSYVKLFGTTIAANADGFISGSYIVSQGAKLRIKIEKGAGADIGVPTHYYLDEVKVAKKEISIREEKNYYPFGLSHRGYNNQVTGTHYPYGFGGKEQQAELDLNWLDFSARNYDAALGRWMNIDPLAEDMRRHSPYNYAFNNPINFIDSDGMAPFWINNGDGTWTAEAGDSAVTLAEDAGITPEEANKIVEDQLGPNYIGEDGELKSDVEVGDVVAVPEQVEEIAKTEQEVDNLQQEINTNEATIAENNKESDSLENVNERVQQNIDITNEIGYKSDWDDPTGGVWLGTLITQTRREFEVKSNKKSIQKNNATNDSLKKENNKKKAEIIKKGYVPQSSSKKIKG